MKAVRDHLLNADLLVSDLTEYRLLIRAHASKLAAEDRTTLIEMIERRQPPTRYTSGAPFEDELRGAKWLRSWQLRLLGELHELGLLSPDVLDRFPELSTRTKASAATDGEIEVLTGWVGDRAEMGADSILNTPLPELIEHLRTWTPPGRIDGPTMRGQGDALSEAVGREPIEFATHALMFKDLDPTYVRSVFDGLEIAVKEKRVFEWGPVLELGEWVLSQPASDTGQTFDRDPGWTWSRKSIADLLDEALDVEAPELSPAHRATFFKLLTALAIDPDRGGFVPEDERRDALTASLNKVSGVALGAVIKYVSWVRRVTEPKSSHAMELAPEAAVLLDNHIDATSVSTRGALGFRFGQLLTLDEEWTSARVDRLFPRQQPTIAALTWQAYVGWNPPRDRVVERFSNLYLDAAQRLESEPQDPGRVDVGEHLADHVALFYLRGVLVLDSPVMIEFYRHAPVRLRAHLIGQIGRLLKSDDVTAEHCGRARALWEVRRATTRDLPDAERREELENFGYWFVAGHCETDWLAHELAATTDEVGSIEPDYQVFEALVLQAANHPVEAIAAVEHLIRAPKVHWFIDAHRTQIKQIVSMAFVVDAARPVAIAVARRLVTVGFGEFEEFAK